MFLLYLKEPICQAKQPIPIQGFFLSQLLAPCFLQPPSVAKCV